MTKAKKQRKSIRLSGYDYSLPGIYFMTICAHNKKYLFGDIVEGKMQLNTFGEIVRHQWLSLPKQFRVVQLDEFIIMPNHVHGIIHIISSDANKGGETPPLQTDLKQGRNGQQTTVYGKVVPAVKNVEQQFNNGNFNVGAWFPRPVLGKIVAFFKYKTTKQINKLRLSPGVKLWQRNYYEHIIRNEVSLDKLREYIVSNPGNWELDKLNIGNFGD